MEQEKEIRIGILSDTHGIYRNEWTAQLKDCDCLIHAGDFNTLKCYETIQALGMPLYAVRGNCDIGDWAQNLQEFLSVPSGGNRFFIVHNQNDLPFDLTDADFVVFGHTHRYTYYDRFGKVFLNPGSAGQPRGDSRSLAILTLRGDSYEVKRVYL